MLTKRIKNMKPSATVELTATVVQMKREGLDIIGFNVGEPDFNTPEIINAEAKKAIDTGFTKYTPASGTLDFKDAICNKLLRDNNLIYNPSEIIVSNGAKQSLINTVLTIIDEGDEVILPTPCWVSYIEMIKLAGGIPVLVQTDENKGFMLDINKINEAITNKTKAIIINTPNNPTGAVYKREHLEALGKLAVEKEFFIISDEVYEKLVYDGEKHISIATLSKEIKNLTITINGLSKAYAMTGWRIGYAAGPKEIIKGMTSLQGHMTSGANSMSQKAGVMALNEAENDIESMKNEFDKRRKYLVERLSNMEGIKCTEPKGAFYTMPNVKELFNKKYDGKELKDSFGVAKFLLNNAHIAVVPGAAFESPDNIRIAYSNSFDNIKEGMNRMEKALKLLD